jgi:serine protease Do
LGVEVETATPALEQQDGLARSNGVLVASVDDNGPAAKAGIQQSDVITGIDGTAVFQAKRSPLSSGRRSREIPSQSPSTARAKL